MADLDDFFAKKDKKKKTKKGFSKANTDVLAKNLEINEKKEQQAEEKANDASRNLRIKETQPEVANDNDADEWLVYEDRKLDYTNLKIDTLKIDGDSDPDAEEEETNEDGEKVKKSKEGGPWSKLVASDSVEIPPEPEKKTPEPVKEEKAEPSVTPVKSSYVPPHLRNAAPSTSPAPGSGGGPVRRKGPKQAPDIASEVYFPSLSAAMGTDDPNQGQDKSPQSGRGFEEVRSSGPSYSKPENAPKLLLDNKFSALRE